MADNEAKMDENGVSKATKTISEINSKKRKSILERSVAWDHFDKIYGPNGELTAKCKYCGFSYPKFKTRNVTLGLKGHMSRCGQ
ncbi:hypothetical protein P3L10_026802 [Capsicum annuum]